MDLSSKTARAKLKVRKDAYFQKLGEGCFVSFRRGPDTWGARFRSADGEQHFETFTGNLEFAEAKRLAEAWFLQMGGAGSASPVRATVAAALAAYVAWLRRQNRHAAAEHAEGKFQTVILGNAAPRIAAAPRDPLADKRLETLTREDWRAWGERVAQGRTPRTVNYYLRAVAAALHVKKRSYKARVGTPETWTFAAPLSGTLEAALLAHVATLRQGGRVQAADEAEARFRAAVLGGVARVRVAAGRDPLADKALEKATKEDFEAWRERMREGREARTVNRYFRAVAAGLNYAHEKARYVGNPLAWTLEELADDVAEGETTAVFLTPKQRKNFLGLMDPAAAALCRGLDYTGARPHELAKARVRAFSPSAGTLELQHRKGRPAKLKTRAVTLCALGVAHLKALAAGKAPEDLLFTDRAGKPWTRGNLANAVRIARERYNARAARAAAGAAHGPNGAVALLEAWEPLPAGTGAYAFRHSRISELLQLADVDPVTVAKQTGTSVAMIEKTYFRFIKSSLEEKLAALNTKLAALTHAAEVAA